MDNISLRALFHANEQKWNSVYNALINSPMTHILDFNICPGNSQKQFPAFFYYTDELVKIITDILPDMNELADITKDIPPIAIDSFYRTCLIEEIKSSNDIEGVNSTRKEISMALDEQGNISASKNIRLWSKVNKYAKLQIKQDISFMNSKDLRIFYDDFISDEIRRADPNNLPDGELFRKSPVEVWSKTKVIHHGIMPESNIIASMDKALEILHDKEIPSLVRIAIYHYLFGYIHPFYDGNGRTSRFITSYYLSRVLSPLVAIRLSITIKKSLRIYYKLFSDTNSYGSRGDLTPFITGFLWLIQKSIIRVKAILKDKHQQLNYYSELLNNSKTIDDKTDKSLCFVLLQASLFSEDGATIYEIANTIGKNDRTVRTHLFSLPEGYLIVNTNHRAHRYMLNLNKFPSMEIS